MAVKVERFAYDFSRGSPTGSPSSIHDGNVNPWHILALPVKKQATTISSGLACSVHFVVRSLYHHSEPANSLLQLHQIAFMYCSTS